MQHTHCLCATNTSPAKIKLIFLVVWTMAHFLNCVVSLVYTHCQMLCFFFFFFDFLLFSYFRSDIALYGKLVLQMANNTNNTNESNEKCASLVLSALSACARSALSFALPTIRSTTLNTINCKMHFIAPNTFKSK